MGNPSSVASVAFGEPERYRRMGFALRVARGTQIATTTERRLSGSLLPGPLHRPAQDRNNDPKITVNWRPVRSYETPASHRASIAGAEEDSRRRLGRGLTAEEYEQVLRRYPGDMAYRRREQPVESIRYFAREIEGGGAEPGVVLTVMTDA